MTLSFDAKIEIDAQEKTKAIYGKATSAEIDELKEEGIQTITIHWIKETEN